MVSVDCGTLEGDFLFAKEEQINMGTLRALLWTMELLSGHG